MCKHMENEEHAPEEWVIEKNQRGSRKFLEMNLMTTQHMKTYEMKSWIFEKINQKKGEYLSIFLEVFILNFKLRHKESMLPSIGSPHS